MSAVPGRGQLPRSVVVRVDLVHPESFPCPARPAKRTPSAEATRPLPQARASADFRTRDQTAARGGQQ
ncbi:hypothetical protein [Streptomyces sp. NPDC050759]|uniref:hypothetical protein n=1 Tax=Streptomyces sp. NPDC050759 TaxID=3365635 RepID=UPI0037A08646